MQQQFMEMCKNYKPYSEEERKEICKAIQKDITNLVSDFFESTKKVKN